MENDIDKEKAFLLLKDDHSLKKGPYEITGLKIHEEGGRKRLLLELEDKKGEYEAFTLAPQYLRPFESEEGKFEILAKDEAIKKLNFLKSKLSDKKRNEIKRNSDSYTTYRDYTNARAKESLYLLIKGETYEEIGKKWGHTTQTIKGDCRGLVRRFASENFIDIKHYEANDVVDRIANGKEIEQINKENLLRAIDNYE